MDRGNVIDFPSSQARRDVAEISVLLRLQDGIVAYEIEGIPDTRDARRAAALQLQAVIEDLSR